MTLKPQRARHFEREYGSVDYKGAVVLDIGADYGCSPEFFLSRGAKHVIASEVNQEWRRDLIAWAQGRPVTVIDGLDTSNARDVFEQYQPEVVKCDCEGCECVLLTLPDEVMAGPRAWVLETHTIPLYRDLRALFGRLGYRLTMIQDFGDKPNKSGKVCKIWKAER